MSLETLRENLTVEAHNTAIECSIVLGVILDDTLELDKAVKMFVRASAIVALTDRPVGEYQLQVVVAHPFRFIV